MTLEQTIADQTQEVSVLTQEVVGKMGAIDARVAAKEAEVDGYIASAVDKLPKSNFLLNSTFLGNDTVTMTNIAGPQTAVHSVIGSAVASLCYRMALNGATLTEVGRFIHSNSTNGGVNGALNAVAQSLLAAMGASNRAAGTEFAIMEADCSVASTSWPITISAHAFAEGSCSTFGLWFQVTTPGVGDIRMAGEDTLIDPATGTPWDDGEWHFYTNLTRTNYWVILPSYGVGVACKINIALPCVFAGDHRGMTPYTTPILHLLERS